MPDLGRGNLQRLGELHREEQEPLLLLHGWPSPLMSQTPALYQPLHQHGLEYPSQTTWISGTTDGDSYKLTCTHPQYFIVVYFLGLHKYKQLQTQISTQSNDLSDVKMQTTLKVHLIMMFISSKKRNILSH